MMQARSEGAKTHPIVVKPNMVETLRVEAPEFRPPCPIVDKDTKLAAKNPVAKESFLQSVTCKTDSTTPSHLLNKSHTHEIDPYSNSGISALAQKFADQVHLGRIPAPEPGVFSGDPLQYPAWRSAFEILVNLKSIPDPEKLYYLKRYLAGDAKAAVEGHLMFPTSDAYKAAMHLLEDRYGDPFSIADAFRNKLDNWPKISTRDGTGLRILSDFLNQCQVAMISNQSLQILNDERENRKFSTNSPNGLVTVGSESCRIGETKQKPSRLLVILYNFWQRRQRSPATPLFLPKPWLRVEPVNYHLNQN